MAAGKSGRRLTLLLLGFVFLLCMAMATSASAQYDPVVTSGSSGCSTVGTYNYTSDVNGKPSFADGNGNSIFWENNKWNLAFTGFTPYYYFFEKTENTPLPPCGLWDNVENCGGTQTISGECGGSTACPPTGSTWYVDASASAGGDGSSWDCAFQQLQQAIEAASSGHQVWVAAGTYKPAAYPSGCVGCSTVREFAFMMKDGVKVYGGFAGTETALSQRNVAANPTILSGDIGIPNENNDNCYHVVISVNDSDNTRLDGFTITGGNANYVAPAGPCAMEEVDVSTSKGGGMANYNSEVVVKNCHFTANGSMHAGGGIYWEQYEGLSLDSCVFTGNRTSNNLGENSAGGAAYFKSLTAATIDIKNCYFVENLANFEGGALRFEGENELQFSRCRFERDSAGYGGALHFNTEIGAITASLDSCVFAENRGAQIDQFLFGVGGGAIHSFASENTVTLDFDSCQFINNMADTANFGVGGAINLATDFFVPAATFLNINKSVFTGNAATFAGAISSASESISNVMTIDSCLFQNNIAKGHPGSYAGAISYGASLFGFGGKIENSIQAPVILSFAMTNSQFYHNSAPGGAGACAIFGDPEVQVDNCVFAFNRAESTESFAGKGGALSISSTVPCFFTNCQFTDNEATQGGGGVEILGVVAFQSTNCTFARNKAYEGGAIYFNSEFGTQSGTFSNCLFEENMTAQGSEQAGGAIYGNAAGNDLLLLIDSCEFINNSTNADGYGGAIYTTTSIAEIGGGGNRPGNENVGQPNQKVLGNGEVRALGRSFQPSSRLAQAEISNENSTVANSAKRSPLQYWLEHQSAKNAANRSMLDPTTGYFSMFLSRSLFNGNESGDGGAVIFDSGNGNFFLDLDSVTFSSNISHAYAGGGMTMYAVQSGGCTNCNVSIDNCFFENNSTAFAGGGLYSFSSAAPGYNFAINRTVFSNNTATGYGGGFHDDGWSAPVFTNCVFAGNSSSVTGTDDGGAAISSYGDLDIVNSTFFGNTSQSVGGAVANLYIAYNVNLTNCIFWGNTAPTGNGQLAFGANTNEALSHCIVQNELFPGTGNSTADPLFLNPNSPKGIDGIWATADDGLSPACGSAAINTATAASAPADDIVGTARPQLSQVDMGAYEALVNGTPPMLFTVSGGGGDCDNAPTAILLSGSAAGVDYQLLIDGQSAGISLPGTGMALDFGIPTESGNYTVLANATGGCQALMTGSALAFVSEPLPFNESWYEHVTVSNINDLNSAGVAYGNGIFVAVFSHYGTNGYIYTSTDGINWTAQTPPPNNNYGFYSVTYENGQFLMTGWSEFVHTSPDGINWTPHNVGALARYTGIAYGNGTWLIVGSDGAIRKSTDNGITWTGIPSPAGVNWGSAAFGNGVFVIGGLGNAMFASTDLVTWTPWDQYVFSYNALSITFGDGKFVAGRNDGNIYTSLNGVNWTLQSPGTPESVGLFEVTYLNGGFYASNTYPETSGNLLSAGDGICWSSQPTGFPYGFLDISFGNGIYTAISADGRIYSTLCHTPVAFEITTGNACTEGSGAVIELSSSEINYNYQLKKDNVLFGTPMPGNAENLTFSGLTEPGVYTILASSRTGNCVAEMTGSITTLPGELPVVSPFAGESCPGQTVNLSATSSVGSIDWYDAETGGNLIGNSASGEDFPVTPGATTTYYAQISASSPGSQIFQFTGGVQTFTVPEGVTKVNVTAKGAGGSDGYYEDGPPGEGGSVTTDLNVTPGQVLNIYVGGLPTGDYEEIGGYNGGGSSLAQYYGAGGGATDIRIGGTALTSRVIVAGGGGGAGYDGTGGGNGGGLVGEAGDDDTNYPDEAKGGGGGTQLAGGAGGIGLLGNGFPGTSGQGGDGANYDYYGAGGGGGFFGGGGGGETTSGYVGAGGGGSSYTDPNLCTNVQHVQGGNPGNGFVTIQWGEGCPSPDRVAVTVDVFEMAITASNISSPDCENTTCSSDDTYTADFTVTYESKPASGTLSLSGPTIVGTAPTVNVSSIGANAYTFTGVTLIADGGDLELTAEFSNGCSITDEEFLTAPACGAQPFVPTNITVSGFGCFGPNGVYLPNGIVNGAPSWLWANTGIPYTLYWNGGAWVIEDDINLVYAYNYVGTPSYLPCTGDWTDDQGLGCIASPIMLSGGCGDLSGGNGGLDCAISEISLSNTGSCDDNGTVDGTDDFFTADVTVTFAYAPAGGTLTLKLGNTILTTTSDDLTCVSTHTFEDAQFPANGQPVALTAEFSQDCSYTSGTLMTAPQSCSCQPASAFTACPTAPTANTATGLCTATLSYTATANGDPAPSYTYSFSGATTGTGSGTGSGSTFNRGTTNVTVTATNDCGSTSCQFALTVVDNQPPSAVCKNHTVALGPNGSATITAANVFLSGTDNCGTVSPVGVSPSFFNCNNTFAPAAVTLTASDGNGNSTTCTATVTVVDNTPPSTTCKSAALALGANGTATLQPASVFLSGTDNCGTVVPVSVSPSAFGCADIGNHNVTLTVRDASNNTATCAATVTVLDNTPPSAKCKDFTLELDENGQATITVGDIDDGSWDACGLDSLSASLTDFYCDYLGSNTVTLTATDVNGNISSCTAVVTVVDVTPPVFTCQGLTIELGPTGTFDLSPDLLYADGSDNCGTVVLLGTSPGQLDCGDIGTNAVILTAADASGNTATCTATVTVKPFITVGDVLATDESCDQANGTISITATALGGQLAYSINGGASWQIQNTFTGLQAGSYSVAVTAFGTSGCTVYIGTVLVGSSGAPATWYKDYDGDGYTDGLVQSSCQQPAGFVATALPGDCDDTDPLEFPGQVWYRDGDNDGYSNGQTAVQCSRPVGYRAAAELVQVSGDCNDQSAAVHPGATELCNNVDDDCNGQVDEGLADLVYVGNKSFTSQAQVNAWSECYTVIQGNLTIINAGIDSLSKLHNLRKVTGNVLIRQTGLDSLSWLLNLDTVGGMFTVQMNTQLKTLHGLDSLKRVGSSFQHFQNLQCSECCAIYDLLNTPGGIGGSTSIYTNKTGCSSVAQINADCDPNSNLAGGGGSLPAPVGGGLAAEGGALWLELSPNPARGRVAANIGGIGGSGQLAVFDRLGRQVHTQALDCGGGGCQVDMELRHLPLGEYYVRVVTDGGLLTKKLILTD